MADLARMHLIEAAPGALGRWRMHDLLRLYAQGISAAHAEADGREYARDRLLRYYLSIAIAADHQWRARKMSDPGQFVDRASALAWLDAERPNLVAAVQTAADSGRDWFALSLPFTLTEYFDRLRRFDDWLATTTKSLEAARRLGDRHREAQALDNIGLALRELRHFDEAITAHQEAATTLGETGSRHGESMALNNLGIALQEVGRFDEAITAYQDAAAILRETGDRLLMGGIMTSLATALQGVRRFDEAITAHRDAGRNLPGNRRPAQRRHGNW